MMTTHRFTVISASTLALLAGLVSLSGCDVEKTQSGRAPDVDVDVDSGELPEYDIDWANVDVGTTQETVTVPKLRVVMEEETVEVPFIDVSMPDDDDEERVRRTLRVSAQVVGNGYDLEIQRVLAVDDHFVVISRLTGSNDGGDKQILSDNIVVNARDLDVRHIIVGQRPAGAYNEQYRYVRDMGAIDRDFDDAVTIFER